MNLAHLLHTIESRLFALGQWLTPDDPRSALHADVERAAEELQQSYRALLAARESLQEACGRLLDAEQRVAELEAAVRTCASEHEPGAALRPAVELEEARAARDAERARVAALRRTCQRSQGRMTHLEVRLAGLQGQLHPC